MGRGGARNEASEIKVLLFLFVLAAGTLYLGWSFVMKKLLESIANTTGGMHVMVHNMDELSTFFRRQVLLSRFIAQTAHGEFRNEYVCYNCKDMEVWTVRVEKGTYICLETHETRFGNFWSDMENDFSEFSLRNHFLLCFLRFPFYQSPSRRFSSTGLRIITFLLQVF